MPNLKPMRYKDFVWPHNPRTYTITYHRRIGVQHVPYGYYLMETMGQSYRILRGSGEFTGANAYQTFSRLAAVFYAEGKGVLVHPCWQSANVYFVHLALSQEPRPDYVTYSFEFWESYDKYDTKFTQTPSSASQHTSSPHDAVFHTVKKGETLWSISRQYNVPLDTLIARNRQIKNPNLIYAGQKVRVT